MVYPCLHTPVINHGQSITTLGCDAPYTLRDKKPIQGIPPTYGRSVRSNAAHTPVASEERSVGRGQSPDARESDQELSEIQDSKSKKRIYGNSKNRKRKMANKKSSKSLTKVDECISKMPPLYHSVPNNSFDIRKSEVVKWMCLQPAIMQWIFDVASHRNSIVYDAETGMWQGANYEG